MLRDDFDEVLERNISFATKDSRACILLHITGIASTPPSASIKPLEEWDFPRDYREYMEACIQKERARWSYRGGLGDDLLPCLKPYYGIAEHSAFVGGKVVFGANTSYHQHPIEEWEDFYKLSLDENNENFRLLLDSMEYLKSREKEAGFIAVLRGGEAPMDMANALRGNDLFTDFYDEPEMVRRLMEFCTEAGKFTFRHQLDIIGQRGGGVMTGMNLWLPGKSIGHLSEDASCMCSPEIYREFGKPYTEKLLEDYDFTVMHTHGMGSHILPEIAAIEKIKWIEISADPNQPRPVELYRRYACYLEGKITVIPMTPQEFMENREFLEGRKTVVQMDVSDLEEGRRVVDAVKEMNG